MDKKLLIKIRDAKVSDQAFIFSSFLKGNYYGNDWFKAIDKTIFMNRYKQVLTQLLIKRSCKIACLVEDEDTVVGYSIYAPGVLDYVFVKPIWRRIGIAKDLIPVGINTVTHLTKIGKAIKPREWIFDPWSI